MRGIAIIHMLKTIKQWLIGPNAPTGQRIYMTALTHRRQKRLDTLAKQAICISPERPKPQLLGKMRWQPLPECPHVAENWHPAAHAFTESQISAIKSYLPDFFRNHELQIDYEAGYRSNCRQTLADIGLPFLARCAYAFSQDTKSRATHSIAPQHHEAPKPIILDSPLAPVLLNEKTLKIHPLPDFHPCYSTVDPLSSQAFKTRRLPMKVPGFTQPRVLVILKDQSQYALTQAALSLLAQEHEIILYLTNPQQLEPALRQQLSRTYFIIDADNLLPDERLIRNACIYFNRRLQQIESLPVPTILQDALYCELERLNSTIHTTCLAETVLTHIQPTSILGCPEDTPLGLAFKTLQSRYPYQLLNFPQTTLTEIAEDFEAVLDPSSIRTERQDFEGCETKTTAGQTR